LIKWTRKKSLWPILCALGCLFVLAVVAPRAWQRYQTKSSQHETAVVFIEPSVSVEPSEKVVTLTPEPQAEQPLRTPPLVVAEPTLPPIEVEPAEVAFEILSGPQLVPPAPSEPTLAKPEFDLDVLLQMRDTLMAMVDRLPSPRLAKPQASVVRPRAMVRITGETDRLAMLERRDSRMNNWSEPSRTAPVPTLARLPDVIQELTPPREPLLRFRPTVLLEQLQQLTTQPLGAEWSEQVRSEVARLTDDHTTPPSAALPILGELEALALSGRNAADQVAYSTNRHHWFQAIQSLERRLAIWQALLDPSVEAKNSIVLATDAPDVMVTLSQVAAALEGKLHGTEWRDYLLLDQIATATSEGAGTDQQGRSKLAQTVLSRMTSAQLTAEQKLFLASEPLDNLKNALQPWAATAVNLDRLIALVERYEAGRELRFAVAIAQIQQKLRWSNAPELRALADHLDLYYRGSNMRLAVTDDLINQMVPKQKPIVLPVNERIAGAKVRGQSRTTTRLRVQLIPDPMAWRFGLEAHGNVYSKTRSETWPARVRNAAKMQYQVRKTITISQDGLDVSPAKALAQGRHELLGVDSQLDGVPLLGSLLRDIARNKNQQSRSKAISQVKRKVISQAQKRMDSEADLKFENLAQKFRENILGPIERLALIAEPRSMFTTDDRAVMQLRLANEGQLAAHTPRPLAPSDSVASLQIHETVLNNALAGLQLDGRRMKVIELFEFFAKKFSRIEAQPSEDLSRRAIIQFADRDAILVNCDDDRVELILNIREVAHGRDKIRNFQVHAYFRPVLHGLDLRLVRDGTLQFSGRRLKTGPRVVLHGVFGKLLEKDREIRLMASDLQKEPRLAGLMVTQLVINDGWIGLALGPAHPERTAWRTVGPTTESMMR